MKDTSWVLIGFCVCALIGGGLYWLNKVDEDEIAAPAEPPSTPAPRPTAAAKIQYPMPDIKAERPAPPADSQGAPPAPQPTPTPLPALSDSDAPLLNEVASLFGEPGLPAFLVPTALIEHIVVTVENLDRDPIRLDFRPLQYVQGQLPVDKTQDEEPLLYLNRKNTQRYAPYVQTLAALDPALVAALYRRYYPLFQQAYTELGYPKAYFNDRLVSVIDHLLTTPRVEYPIRVVQPKVYYEFADPALEALSWGQKTLIRTGPEHAATVKAFLRAFRTELTRGSKP